ncbi:hypothetical protein BC628DRAFT_1386978 [Trametes gibbosa]|nr:hypothetical protein BC628DRAFT_1386978 [Trametes gibbosa]
MSIPSMASNNTSRTTTPAASYTSFSSRLHENPPPLQKPKEMARRCAAVITASPTRSPHRSRPAYSQYIPRL